VIALHSFDAKRHQHFLDGQPVPSVTQILDRAGLRDVSRFTEDSRERGRDVHLICAWEDERTLIDTSVDEEYRPHLHAFRKFRRENPRFRPKLIEAPVWDEVRRYAGILDRLEEIDKGESEAVLDIKSGAYDDTTALQTAGYDGALPPPRLRARERFGLYLHDNGTYDLEPYKDPGDRFVFFSALAVVQWQLRSRGETWKQSAA
jgi:hypothetical protein